MALTRKFLKAMGIEDEKIEEIIAAHGETVSALKEESEKYKADAESLPNVKKQLDDTKKALETAGKDGFKVKYDALKEDFDAYKADVTKKEARSTKETAYREVLKNAGVSDKRIDAVLKVSDVDGIEIDADGKIKDADKLAESIKTEWADFIVTEDTKGAHVENPPSGSGKPDLDKMPDDEYYAYMASQQKKE